MNRLAAGLFGWLWAVPVLAAEEEHAAHAPSVNELWFPLINFLIFLYLIKRYALPLARDYFKNRRAAIAGAVEEADEAQRRAAALLGDYRNRLAQLDQEMQTIRNELRAEGEREKNKLLAEANEIGARIKADADFLAEQEIRLARLALKREIVEAARAAAEKFVRDQIGRAHV